MTICNNCGGHVPDIGGHQCLPGRITYLTPPQPIYPRGNKCDICGSTAIDHTEIQCQLNRINTNKGVSKAAKKERKPLQK